MPCPFIREVRVCTSKCQIDCEDFVKFCGLLRKHKLETITSNAMSFYWSKNIWIQLTLILDDLRPMFGLGVNFLFESVLIHYGSFNYVL